ncbi:capsule biosynthesis protein [Palleronia caenipelagi]|nr:capsule biosynthesis protein [Palleronia caenipelagi]
MRRSSAAPSATGSDRADPSSDAVSDTETIAASDRVEAETLARDDRTAEPAQDAVFEEGTENSPELDAIKHEGLSDRQLRIARRLAKRQNLDFSSDLDAVRQLRKAGIDPFGGTYSTTVPPAPVPTEALPTGQSLVPAEGNALALPDTNGADDPDLKLSDLREIHRDLVRRRRRRFALLMGRLAFFIGLPTAMTGYYYYNLATPMYATKSEFVIQQADGAGSTSLGGLFAGTGFATSQDSITVQSYLTSRDAMLRLDEELSFKDHFEQDFIDPIRRLPQEATNEEAYKLYEDNVKIGYDTTEGIIKMEVIAADPLTSAEFSLRLLSYAEERVDQLTQRMREDQMSGARASYEDAELKMYEAQQRVLALQEQLGILDPEAESGAVFGQITRFETEIREKQLSLQQLMSNEQPNEARVNGLRADISRLEDIVAELRTQLTEGTNSAQSLAKVTAELRIAETELTTRTALMQQALQQLETARIEANRQVRYLSLGVTPIAPDEPSYPRAFENTLVAFFIYSGIYLMISLTASVLREQVSS